MGYSHSFKVHDWDSKKWQRAWPRLVRDTRRIIEELDIRLCGNWPNANWGSKNRSAPLVDKEQGIAINGVEDNGHELFLIEVGNTEKRYCKTARKPYDTVVACIMLRAYVLAPDCVEITSDGSWDNDWEWGLAREVYTELWPEHEDKLVCPFKE